jgi:hypothetical protein
MTMATASTRQTDEQRRMPRSSRLLTAATGDLRIVEPDLARDEESVIALLRIVLAKVERLGELFAFVPLLIAQTGRCTSHLTVDMAALALGVSVKTIRRRIREKKLVLETIPGTRLTGIRIEQLFRDWLPIELARRIADDELRELASSKDQR